MIKVMAQGVFDVIHPGHVKHLREARALGDFLVVGIVADRWVTEYKGPGRPVFTHDMRRMMLMSFEFVDQVVIIYEPETTGVEHVIAKVKPQIYVKGNEYEGRLREQAFVESIGGRCVFLEETEHSSTSVIHHSERVRMQEATEKPPNGVCVSKVSAQTIQPNTGVYVKCHLSNDTAAHVEIIAGNSVRETVWQLRSFANMLEDSGRNKLPNSYPRIGIGEEGVE